MDFSVWELRKLLLRDHEWEVSKPHGAVRIRHKPSGIYFYHGCSAVGIYNQQNQRIYYGGYWLLVMFPAMKIERKLKYFDFKDNIISMFKYISEFKSPKETLCNT